MVNGIINKMPDWMIEKPEIIGIEVLKGWEKSEFHLQNYTVFIPHILFMILSIYTANRIPEWHQHDKIVEEDIQ